MAIETQYNIVKVNELRPITTAMGNDEIIINDVDSYPLETKKITAENFAKSIKDYILPIAGEGPNGVLGGVKIGDGLTINPITGVLSNDVLTLGDLDDVIILNPEAGHVLRHNGVQWVNEAEGGFTNIIAGEGLSGGGTTGEIVLNVNAGRGLSIVNDAVTVNVNAGLEIVNDYINVRLNTGLTFSDNKITYVLTSPLLVKNGALTVDVGKGLMVSGTKLQTKNGRGLLHTSDEYLELDIGQGLSFQGNTLIGSPILNDLLDVEINNPTANQIVKYDEVDGKWKNVDVDTLNLNDLGDVTITNANEHEALIYDGSEWINQPISGVNDVVYKKVVNARLSLSATSPIPVAEPSEFNDRIIVTSNRLYLHPYQGSEIGLYDPASVSWYLAPFDGVLDFPMVGLNAANTNYDIYIHNASSIETPSLVLTYKAWPDKNTEPTRGVQDGILVDSNDPTKKYMGVIRTTSPNTSEYDLGGIVTVEDGEQTPKCLLANHYNLFTVNLFYVFGTSWSGLSRPPSQAGWGLPNPYYDAGKPPKIDFVTSTREPVMMLHNQSGTGNYTASNLGIDLPQQMIDDNNQAGVDYGASFSQWCTMTRTIVIQSGATGFFNRTMTPGHHQITYWWDSCGGIVQNAALTNGFNITIKV